MTDLDGAADGVIEDPIAIGSATATVSNAGDSGGGGAINVILLFLIPFIVLGYRYSRKRS